MVLSNLFEFSTAVIIVFIGGVCCLNERIEDIITDPTAVHCTTNPCSNNATCYVVYRPGTNENSEVECTGDTCFKFVFEPRSWHEATADCASIGGELASFETTEQLHLIRKSSINGELYYNCPRSGKNHDIGLFWTSGTNNSNEWTWRYGNSSVDDSILDAIRRSNDDPGTCLLIGSIPGTCNAAHWKPANCTQKYKYICEIHKSIVLTEMVYQCRCDGDHYGINCNSTYLNYDIEEETMFGSEAMTLACPPEMVISVEEVVYGMNIKSCDGSRNATILVGELCHERNNCSFTVNQETLGNVACTTTTDEDSYSARVVYACKPKESVELHYGRVVSCGYDDDPEYPVYITCHGWPIWIQYAYFGHMAERERGYHCQTSKKTFFQDDHKDGCSSSHFLEYLMDRCNGKTVCGFVKDHKLLRYRCENRHNISEYDLYVFIDVRFICGHNISEENHFGEITTKQTTTEKITTEQITTEQTTTEEITTEQTTTEEITTEEITTEQTTTEEITTEQTTTEQTTTEEITTEQTTTKQTTTKEITTEETTTEKITMSSISKCPSEYQEGLHWNATDPGVTSNQSCPDNQSGSATWICTSDGEWHGDGPNFDLCVPEWIDKNRGYIEDCEKAAVEIASIIQDDLESTGDVNVETISQTVELMDELLVLQQHQLVSEENKTDVAVEFQKELLHIASDLLTEDILDVLEDDKENEAAKTGTSISDEVEESAFLLADTLSTESIEIKSDNIEMKVRAVEVIDGIPEEESDDDDQHYVLSIDGDDYDDDDTENTCSYLKLPRLTEEQTTTLLALTDGPEEVELSTVEDFFSNLSVMEDGCAIYFAGDSYTQSTVTISSNPTRGKLQMMFVKYKTLGRFLESNPNTDKDSIITEDYNRTLFTNTSTEKTKTVLNSNVIGASLRFADHPVTEFEDGQTVQFCLTDLNPSLVGERKCVFWSFNKTTNAGEWLSDGCNTTKQGDHVTVCTCNHMTNFAILMDVHDVEIPLEHESALGYITIIGCSISIVSLLACIFTFSILTRLKSLRTTIHRNLCISLAASQFLFIVGVNRTENKVVCAVIAGVLHYFFLVSFMWMCLEGIHLYITLVRVFNADEHGALHYYLAGYALPLIVVVALAGTVPEGYGTEDYCWLKTDNNFIFAFVAPVAAIILVNFVILVVSLKTAYSSSKAMKQDAAKTHQLRTWVKGAITLLFLLGSTWATGLLFINDSSVVMAYIFTILNSLQGFFIFLFYCFNNDAIKKETRRWLSRKTWVPEKIRKLLKEKPKMTTANTLTTNTNQIEPAKKIDYSPTITCTYSDDYTISSLLTPANMEMVNVTMPSRSNRSDQGNVITN